MGRQQAQRETALVKMLVYVLGVAPAEFGLVPDGEGWVGVKELLKALHEEEGWGWVREGAIRDAAQRLAPDELELEGRRVRCVSRRPPRPSWGEDPPPHLYLGLRRRAWPVVRQRGLSAGESGPVVLAADEGTALRWGRRRDPEPVLVTVQARRAAEQGAVFGRLEPELWLAEWVPADCLMGPPVEERPAPARSKPAAKPTLPPPEALPGSFVVTPEQVEKPYRQKGLRKRIAWKEERRRRRRR